MPSDEKMSVDERRKYLKFVMPRYKAARRAERRELLTEMAAVTCLHPPIPDGGLLRLLHGPTLERAPKGPRFRRRRHGAVIANVIRVVWESLDYVCAERLTPLLPRRKPQPPNRLLREVPMERLSWATAIPGSFETDLVHHCGFVSSAEYVHTLQLGDIATGWSERVAVLGRSQAAMVEGFRRVQRRLPFPITQLHSDNGSEFFNDHLIRYFGEGVTGLRLSRSRPYRKNDNRFVEQKNGTLVRAYVGYERPDSGRQCAALNVLYDQLWVYYNLFQPVLHMVGKEVVGVKLRRKWDQAQMPYQRLLVSGILSPEQEVRLAALYAGTNPRQLRQVIYQAVERLWQRPKFANETYQKEAALLR